MFRNPRKAFIAVFAAALALLIAAVAYATLVEPRSISETHLQIEGAPPRAVFLADLHFHEANHEYLGRVVDRVNSLDPEIVLIGGDFILDSEDDIQYLSALSRLKGRKFAVLGNHDYFAGIDYAGSQRKLQEKESINLSVSGYDVSPMADELTNLAIAGEVKAQLEAAGFTVLENNYSLIRLGGKDYLIIGLDDCWAGRTSMPALPDADYKILLLHEPECLAGWGYNLSLTGHTHGGQVILPLLGPPQAWSGIYSFSGMLVDEPGKKAYVTRGVGSYPWPGLGEYRFNCPPEIVVVNG